jgi:DNA ligase-1
MLLAGVVETSARVANTSRRLEKIELLAALLDQLAPEEVEPAVAFLSGLVRQGRVGVGYATLEAAAAPPAGEAGLTVGEVDRALEALAAVEGRGSEARKREALGALFARATEAEQRFLARLLLGELRQGALEGVMLEAVARAARVDAGRVRRAAMMAGDIVAVARAALESGAAGLDRFDIRLFRPVQPMLAQPCEGVEEALRDLGEAALEMKLDGARIQVHRSGGEVRVFSRALNDLTAAVPEVVEAARSMPGREAILDGELIAFAPDGRPHPFQVTARRFGRKVDLDRMRGELPLTPVWFDALYLDGRSLIERPQSSRFDALRDLVDPRRLVPHTTTADPAEAAAFLRDALERGHEGIMAKARDSIYAAGARGQSWLKIKKAHTLDLVVLAAEWGHGRRRGWLSNLHLGARDEEKGGFAMLGKTFKGLTDEMLAWQTAELLKIEIARDEFAVYVEPKLVVEIAFNDIQLSPRYKEGLALRFARVRRYRTDRAAGSADTLATVRKLAGYGSRR